MRPIPHHALARPLRGLVALAGLAAVLLTVPPTVRVEAQQDFTGMKIRKITVEGLTRTSEEELLLNLGEKVRLGQDYDEIAISNVTKTLYLKGTFTWIEDPIVRPYEDGIEIVFRVQEKPVVRSVRFIAEDTPAKKTSLSAKTLREAVSTKVRGLLSPYSLQMDVEQILRSYREDGYIFAEANHVRTDKDDGAHIVFMIKEGPRVRIRDVSFDGNKTVESSTLAGLMATRRKDWFFGLFHSGFYDAEELQKDIDKLEAYYHSLGFFDALVALDRLEFYDESRKLRIHIVIEEGPRYTFTGYKIEGNNVFSTPVLLGLTQARPGRFFSAERMEADRAEVLKYYKDRAYIEAEVTPSLVFQETGTTVEARFDIKEDHEIYIDHVHIRGNVKTKDHVIRRELEFFPGEKVNWERQQKSRSNLARLRFFRDIDYEFLPGSARNRRDVVVRVEEEATGRLLMGFGVTSGFGVIGNFAITKRNFDFTDLPDSIYDIPDSFTGAGQTLNIVLQPGTQRSVYQFSFTEPYLFETRNALTVAGSATKIIRRDYDEDRLSFRPSLAHAFDFDRDLELGIGLRVEQIEISDIDRDAAPDVFAVEGFTSIVAAHARLSYDKVLYEPLEGPYAGHKEWIAFEHAGVPLGAEVDFEKLEGSLDLFYPIYVHEEGRLHHVIGIFSKFGVMEGHHNTESIPIFERFFLGGPNTVRGFRFRGLGPHFKKDALGGAAAWYGNVEYVFPIFKKFVRGVVFFDYGNLAVEPSTFEFNEMRYSVGAGLRMNFPFLGQPLPIGLYFGKAIESEDFDRERTFLFTVGAPF